MSRTVIYLLITAAVLADQLTKVAVLSFLPVGTTRPVIPGINLTLGFNEGASFGMLGSVMEGKPLLMVALTGTMTLIFAAFAMRAERSLERAGFALIVGGALSNIIDRLRRGAVTDFLDLYWRDWHWPTFNVADIAITIGVVLILAASLPLKHCKELIVDKH